MQAAGAVPDCRERSGRFRMQETAAAGQAPVGWWRTGSVDAASLPGLLVQKKSPSFADSGNIAYFCSTLRKDAGVVELARLESE